MQSIRFEDVNTRSLWNLIIGSANVSALNFVLRSYDVSFGDVVISGNMKTTHDAFYFENGVLIVKFPSGGELLHVPKPKPQEIKRSKSVKYTTSQRTKSTPAPRNTKSWAGAVLVYGNTNCIDTAFGGNERTT